MAEFDKKVVVVFMAFGKNHKTIVVDIFINSEKDVIEFQRERSSLI